MNLIIFGNSDIARCAFEYFTCDSEYEVVGFTVDPEYLDGEKTFLGLPLVSTDLLEREFPPCEVEAFVAIASNRLNRDRTQKYELLKAKGYKMASYISSKAFIWPNVKIGEHAFILENNTIQPFVEIGSNVTLWSGNHIGHSSKIGDNCFVSSHVVISGFCSIERNCFLGVNATISEGVKIAEDNFIGMSAIVNKDTQENQVIAPKRTDPWVMPAKRFCRVVD